MVTTVLFIYEIKNLIFPKMIFNILFFDAGSKSKVFSPIEINRPDIHNNNHDIYGSRSRMLHVGLAKPEFE